MMKPDFKFLLPLSLAVVILNTTAIYVILRTKGERRKSTTMILVSLLIGDILIGVVVIPARIIEIHLLQSAAFPYMYAYILFVAVFNVAFLTWERYASITRPLWRRRIGNGTIITILVINWTLPGLISLIPLCWEYADSKRVITTAYRYVLVTILLTTVLVVVAFQGLILRGLYYFWKGRRGGKCQVLAIPSKHAHCSQPFKKKLKSFLLVITVTMSTILTWMPTIILNFRPDWSTTWVTKLSLYSFFVNSLVDPMFILIFNSDLVPSLLRQRRASRSMHKQKTNSGSHETTVDLVKFKNIHDIYDKRREHTRTSDE